MRYISEIESPDNVRILVMQDLKELGIKVPKTKSKNKTKEESAVSVSSLTGHSSPWSSRRQIYLSINLFLK